MMVGVPGSLPARPLPDFLCIGAQKAGTTWLYRNLRAHPGLWLPYEKELHYFDEKLKLAPPDAGGHAGAGVRTDGRWMRQLLKQLRRGDFSRHAVRWQTRYFLGRRSDAWYASLFVPGMDRLTGEITPGYATLGTERVAHVRRVTPYAKIIFFMRNPVERAWSHASMEVSAGHGGAGDVAQCLEAHFDSDGSRQRTDYLHTLDVWQTSFPPDQIFVGFLEDVTFHPEALLGRLCSFLGVEEPPAWPHARVKAHVRTKHTIPGDLAARLAEMHGDSLAELSRRFGGYADWWCFVAERLRSLSPGCDVAFPFHEGPLWREWSGCHETSLRSAVLSDLQA